MKLSLIILLFSTCNNDSILLQQCTYKMKQKRLEIRISERRLNNLREYAVSRDKTMTSIIEDLIDSLPQNTLPARRYKNVCQNCRKPEY